MTAKIFTPSMATADLSATTNTGWLLIDGCSIVSIQQTWTGTPAGTFTLQATDSHWPLNKSDTVLTADGTPAYDLGAVFSAIPAGSASSGDDQFSNVAAKWVRIKYTRSSGTGTWVGRVTAKRA